ncbi:TIGR03089 family protein [Arthrobacter sp. RIT-PI-e]|uniref:TIGR03089 family protein n=1 Tax=Arthrobacter sp. RIT-PI-e TaxID=1681197 RepID=UPI000A9DF298|nr:TIGR03089 family protein [Arthrobacter sp. RIT-PI-e]
MRSVPTPDALLTRMRTIDASSPRLIWHGSEGRIELSGRVFDNWVAKSSNLLADELDVVEGSVLAFDLPVHWKTLALAFACWQTGGVVLLPPGAPAPAPAPGGILWQDAAAVVLCSGGCPRSGRRACWWAWPWARWRWAGTAPRCPPAPWTSPRRYERRETSTSAHLSTTPGRHSCVRVTADSRMGT